MGTITSIFNMVALKANQPSSSAQSSQTPDSSSGSGSSVFGEAVNVSLFTESLSEAATGRIVDETILGASITGTCYQSNGTGYTDTGFEAYLGNLNIPIIVNGKYADDSTANVNINNTAGSSSVGSASDEMNKALKSLENNIQTAINNQPFWQQKEAEDALLGTVADFSKSKPQG